MNSYYQLLGVPPNATEMEIRSAYGRDVLRLQEMTSDKVAQFRAALDSAFTTLVDPAKRSAYDAELATAIHDGVADSVEGAADAFSYARNGGLWFAGGGLVTALTYAFSEGTYFLAWGPLLFGGFQLVRGLLRYIAVPSQARKASHLAILGGLVAVGILSAGFVGVSERQAAQEAAELDKWNAMVDAYTLPVTQASDLVTGVANRPGPWNATDSADMAKASALYASVADVLATATTPARFEWYRAGMLKNFREAAGITHDYSLQSSSSLKGVFEALDNRWHARVEDANAMSNRFAAQVGRSP